MDINVGTGARGLRLGLLSVVLASAMACSPVYRSHGYIPSESELMAVEPGVDTRESVIEVIGQPTTGSVLDNSAMYYVASRFRHFGPLEPQEIERQVVAISFTDQGLVRNIERFGLEDGRVVTLSRRVTEGTIQDRTFLRQLLGNIGNIDAGNFIGDE